MIIYNPYNEKIIKKRAEEIKAILSKIPTKYCFITGSFLYKERYEDIDVFIISRTKKDIKIDNKNAAITIIDFNDLYSLFYHSLSKSCIAKNILPIRPLKVTISDYWHVINEAIPTLLNQKNRFHKDIRFLILYTEYFKTGNILDTFQLSKKLEEFKNYKEILNYVKKEVPYAINKRIKKSYIKRFFYTQAGFYKELLGFKAQRFLYDLVHAVTRGAHYG